MIQPILRGSETYLKSILQALPIAVFMKDAKDLRFVLWNKFNEDLCGLTFQEVVGKSDHDFFPKEQADQFVAKDREVLKNGQLIEVEEQIQTRHKGVRLLSTRKIPIFDESGQPLYLLGISEDITDRKQADLELAYERDLLRSLLDNSLDRIYFKDLKSRFIRASQETCNSVGVSAQAIVGKSDFDLFTEAHARPAFEDEQEIIRTGQPMIGKIEKETFPDGRQIWVLTSKLPLRNRGGEIIGTFGLSKDITTIKQSEAKLEQVHKQLVEASRQAGMAEVATSVLHNVGNVLNSINISATLTQDQIKNSRIANVARVAALMREHAADLPSFLTQDPKGQQLPSYLAKLAEHLAQEQTTILEEIRGLKKNVEHINEIVSMQQSYARIAGVTDTVKVTDLVEDALRINAGALTRHEVTLLRDYAPNLPDVTVEKHKVLQVLVNLIRNAKYACDESGSRDKQLKVRVAASEGNDRVRIEVIDNGVGIPAENLTRIFNHGFSTRKEGHGFGLHSGALAATELRGRLTAFSEGPGKGATFTLEFPCQPKNG